MKKLRRLCWLFGINLFISAFTFGGGYVVIPMIRKYYVERMHCFDEEELLKIAAIAQSSPGAIAINMSALAGYKTAGKSGMLVSCIAAVLPPLLILAVVSMIYDQIKDNKIVYAVLRGMEAGVAALIVDLIIDMYSLIRKEKEAFFIWMTPCVFVLNYCFSVDVAVLILSCVLLCIGKALWERRCIQ